MIVRAAWALHLEGKIAEVQRQRCSRAAVHELWLSQGSASQLPNPDQPFGLPRLEMLAKMGENQKVKRSIRFGQVNLILVDVGRGSKI